jgi:mono/diheme cytochrome c family protein
MIRLLLTTVLAAPLFGQTPAAAPSGNAQKGRQLFQSYGCYQCHGREAQGEAGTGPRLAPKPIPFAALSKYVRQPTGQMPPYTKKVVSDQDLADIYAFLSAQPSPPPAKSIPLLNN